MSTSVIFVFFSTTECSKLCRIATILYNTSVHSIQFGIVVHFHEGLTDVNQLDGRSRALLIIDDLMAEADDSI